MFYQTYTAHKAAEITPGSDGMVSSSAAWCHLLRVHSIQLLPWGYGSGQRVFLSLVTLAFDLDIQTRPSEDQAHLPREFGTNPFSRS